MDDGQLKPPLSGAEENSGKTGLDDRLFYLLRTKIHPRPLELLIAVFSTTGSYGFFWLGLAAVFWLAGTEQTPGIFALMPVVLYPTLLINYLIKLALGRQRPQKDDEILKPLVKVPSSLSFPSSHAAMSFAAAVFMTYFHRELWPLFFGLAFLMSWSRVYVGVHYPSDVVAGTVVGLIMGGIILWILT